MIRRIAFALLILVPSLALAQQPKISIGNLPAAVVPLNGSEIVPIVQSGVTRRVPLISIFTSLQTTPAGLTGLVGYLRGNNTGPVTATSTIPLADLTGLYATGDFAPSPVQTPRFLPSAARGSVFYKGASGNAALSPGSSGNVLTSNGLGADPAFKPPVPPVIPPIHYAGEFLPMAAPWCPPNALPANGSSYSPTTYPQLYDRIGTTWGGSPLAPLLPDTRGQFLRGWSGDQTVDSGRTFGSTQLDALMDHIHGFGYSRTGINNGNTNQGNGQNGNFNYNTGADSVTTNTNNVAGAARVASETRPTNITAYYCIFTADSP